MGELLDIVDQAEELPLPVHLLAATQREAVQPLIVPEIREHRLHRREAAAVVRAPLRGVEPTLHLLRVRLDRGQRAALEEHHLTGRRFVRRAQATLTMRARHAVAFRAAELRPAKTLHHQVAALAIERLPCGANASAHDGIVGEVTRLVPCRWSLRNDGR